MKYILILISFLSLALTIVPAFLVFAGTIPLDQSKNLMALGTLGWFVTAPFWMKQKSNA